MSGPAPADPSRLRAPMDDGVVRLEPMTMAHREALRTACAADTDIWTIYPANFAGADFDASFDAYLGHPGRVVFALLAGDALVGMSGYLNVAAADRVLEIGGTYLAPEVRGTGLNRRFKALLIGRALECGFDRIEFRIDARNSASQRAVEKLGAVREGVLRRQRTTWTGYRRDTVVYGLLAEEWRG